MDNWDKTAPKDRRFAIPSFNGNYELAKKYMVNDLQYMNERQFDVLWGFQYLSSFWKEVISAKKTMDNHPEREKILPLYEEYKLGKSKQRSSDIVFFSDECEKLEYFFRKIFKMTKIQFNLFLNEYPITENIYCHQGILAFIVLGNELYTHDYFFSRFEKLDNESCIYKQIVKIKKIYDPYNYFRKYYPNGYTKWLRYEDKLEMKRDQQINSVKKEIDESKAQVAGLIKKQQI
jgi:hypothetical protein